MARRRTFLSILNFGGRAPSQSVHFQTGRERAWPQSGPDRVWLFVHGGISTLLGWPQTEWCYLTNDDIPEAAALLARLCKEFIDAVPGLWESSGLGREYRGD